MFVVQGAVLGNMYIIDCNTRLLFMTSLPSPQEFQHSLGPEWLTSQHVLILQTTSASAASSRKEVRLSATGDLSHVCLILFSSPWIFAAEFACRHLENLQNERTETSLKSMKNIIHLRKIKVMSCAYKIYFTGALEWSTCPCIFFTGETFSSRDRIEVPGFITTRLLKNSKISFSERLHYSFYIPVSMWINVSLIVRVLYLVTSIVYSAFVRFLFFWWHKHMFCKCFLVIFYYNEFYSISRSSSHLTFSLRAAILFAFAVSADHDPPTHPCSLSKIYTVCYPADWFYLLPL